MVAIYIAGIPKAELLAALVNGTRPLGMGVLQDIGPMTVERAQARIDALQSHDSPQVSAMQSMSGGGRLCFDYVEGRPVKSEIGGDMFDPHLYDRDAGEGAAEQVVAKLRARFPR